MPDGLIGRFMTPLQDVSHFTMENLCSGTHIAIAEAIDVRKSAKTSARCKSFGKNAKMRTAMTEILFGHIKLVMLFAWIAAVIVLSHISRRSADVAARQAPAHATKPRPAETNG
jgi:hypothetical protein